MSRIKFLEENKLLEKKPFTPYKLEEERAEYRKKSIVIPVRVNNDEQNLIKDIKELLNIHSDSKALKISARVGLNVLQDTFSKKVLKYLCANKRDRLVYLKHISEEK